MTESEWHGNKLKAIYAKKENRFPRKKESGSATAFNVWNRIYGPQYKMAIASEEGKGTEITFRVPKLRTAVQMQGVYR
ncbi:hypothetical protein [Maridesulfovibrio sp.]|uniref:hypothetical protein n=1 Tax=Maridesulfovibrio sp. TaxID=2795000 RepID=UPI0039EF1C58